jgi:hypothetical protein
MTVPLGLSNVVSIAGGFYHSLALQSNGMVVAWGVYYDGSAYVPMTVPPGLSNVVAIAAGAYHSLAIESNGTVVAWGQDSYGQTNVPPGLSNVVAIAGGGYHSLALQSNGIVVAWGDSGSSYTDVPPGLSNVVAIAGGLFHSLAITLGPEVSSQPPAVILLASGGSTNLSVSVSSESPFTCQWSLNGLPIAGATAATLVIDNFDSSKAGVYLFAVTNQYGYATAVTVVRLTNSPVVLVDDVDVGGGTVTPVHLPQVIMTSTFGTDAEIYYTLDGSEPDFAAIPYFGAFTLTSSATIRAIAYNFAYTDWAEAAPISVQVWPTYLLAASTLRHQHRRHAHGDTFQRLVVPWLDRRQHRHRRRYDGLDGSALHRASVVRHFIECVYEWERSGAIESADRALPFWFNRATDGAAVAGLLLFRLGQCRQRVYQSFAVHRHKRNAGNHRAVRGVEVKSGFTDGVAER